MFIWPIVSDCSKLFVVYPIPILLRLPVISDVLSNMKNLNLLRFSCLIISC